MKVNCLTLLSAYRFRWLLHSEHCLREQTAATVNVDRAGKVDTRVSLWHLMHIQSLSVDWRCRTKTIQKCLICVLTHQLETLAIILDETMRLKINMCFKGTVHSQLEIPPTSFWELLRWLPIHITVNKQQSSHLEGQSRFLTATV